MVVRFGECKTEVARWGFWFGIGDFGSIGDSIREGLDGLVGGLGDGDGDGDGNGDGDGDLSCCCIADKLNVETVEV